MALERLPVDAIINVKCVAQNVPTRLERLLGLLGFSLSGLPASLSLSVALFPLKAPVVLLRPTGELGIELVVQYADISITQNTVLIEPIVPSLYLEARHMAGRGYALGNRTDSNRIPFLASHDCLLVTGVSHIRLSSGSGELMTS